MFWNQATKALGLLLLALALLTGAGASLAAWQEGGGKDPEAKVPAPKSVADPERRDEPLLATVKDVLEAFETNDALADELFTNHRVRVKGTVMQIRRSGQDGYVLSMTWAGQTGAPDGWNPGAAGDGTFRWGGGRAPAVPALSFAFPADRRKELAKLRQAQVVTVEGLCKGKLVTGVDSGRGTRKDEEIRFVDCRLVAVHLRPEESPQGSKPAK